MTGVPMLKAIDVTPHHGQVALLDATWQDYPEWEAGNETVAYKAESLIDPDSPPYPGFAVAARSDPRERRATVKVELWASDRPFGLRLIHESVLSVGRAGVVIGDDGYSMLNVEVPTGKWAIEIWTDADHPSEASRVVFVLPDLPAEL
jgi:hypothetical protein